MEETWGAVFKILEKWREDLGQAGGEGDPSVTAMAVERKRDPWAVLVSTVLSLRTKDEVTAAAARALLEKAAGPAELLALGEKETARLIYPAGFYRTKAANLQKIAAILLCRYEGCVPPDMEALLALPGVGRKTANLVITEAFGMDGICVDIHVHRISNRLGWVETESPEKTETALRETLPRQYWKRINALLVKYGQKICRPVSPFCSRCAAAGFCPRRGVGKSR
ncbi:MAG: endonuclease III [Treponema sp.]|nr:endonuclease III [Treponema sp.]